MFSTSLTCIDGYPRALAASLQRIVPAWRNRFKPLYFSAMGIITLLSLAVVGIFVHSLKAMLGLAMILSFLAAPVFAIINYRIVTADFMPAADRPGPKMRILSWIGILFLIGFSLLFIISNLIKT